MSAVVDAKYDMKEQKMPHRKRKPRLKRGFTSSGLVVMDDFIPVEMKDVQVSGTGLRGRKKIQK